MPDYPPPAAAPSRPRLTKLGKGSQLYRVHSASLSPSDFNPTSPTYGHGGRFDSPDGQPAFLYASFSTRAAIAESLLRSAPFDDGGAREVGLAALRGRCLSELRVTADIKLVSLHGVGLARLGQDTWLVHSDSADYPRTREWATTIMRWSPSAAGVEWRPRNDDDGLAVCLYENRMPARLEVVRTLALEAGEGRAVVRSALLSFGVAPP